LRLSSSKESLSSSRGKVERKSNQFLAYSFLMLIENDQKSFLNSSKTVLCFLVINKIDKLPEMAISSLRAVTNSEIYIGFVDDEDIENIPKYSGISYVRLAPADFSKKQRSYQDFTQNDFFSLVQFKWVLLENVLEVSRAGIVIYVDLDVLWVQNPIPSIEKLLENDDYIIAIQDFTKDVSSPNLCMGFFAIKNSPKSLSLLKDAKMLHARMLEENVKVGDDDVITEMYKLEKWKNSFYLLPQTTFPVGNLANLFSKKNFYPGLSFPKPYIFHTNYVIGNHRKIEFMHLMANRFGVPFRLRKIDRVKLFVTLNLRKFKLSFTQLREGIRR
jgi:hypothetical protein